MKNQRPVLTNEEKILLNLLHLAQYSEEFEVPHRMAQEGMARYLGAARPNITRSLKNLQRKGVVEERLAHITGHRRRKKVYYLTPKGMVEAEKLERSLGKAIGLKEGGGASVLEAYLGSEAKAEGAGPAVRPRTDPMAMPRTPSKPFYGRSAELKRMGRWLDEKDPYFLVLTGIAGIGKTTLARRFLEQKGAEAVWQQFHEANTLEGLLHQLGLKLSLLGMKGLFSLTSNPTPVTMRDPYFFAEALASDLRGSGSIFVMDDFHLAEPRIGTFFGILLKVLDEKGAEGVKVLVTSRRKGDFYSRRDVKVKGRVVEVELEGLDPKSSRSLLEGKGVGPEDFERIYSVTRGHPLALELTDATADVSPYKDALEFVREEIFQNFTEEEKTVVQLLSVYRYPVPHSWLVQKGTKGSEALDSLVDRSIVRYSGMGYELHGLVREFAYERLGQKDRVLLHKNAAEMYMDVSQDFLDRLEAVHHLIKAGDPPRGAGLLIESAEEMIQEGFFEVSYVLEDLEGRILEPPMEVWLDYIKGALLSSLGETKNASDFLTRALERMDRLPEKERPRLQLRAFDKLALVSSIQGDEDKAREFYEKAEGIYKGLGKTTPQDQVVYANVLNGHALLMKRRDDLGCAKRLYREGLKVLGDLDDPALESTIHFNIGRMLEEEGKIQEAREEYLEGLDLAEAAGSSHVLVSICNALGEMHSRLNQWDDALSYFEKGLTHAAVSKDVSDTTRVYLEMADQYRESVSPKGFFGRFKSYFSGSGLGEAESIAQIYDRISALYLKLWDLDGACEFQDQAVAMFARNGDLRMEAKARNNLGLVRKQKNDSDGAVDEYLKALALLEKAGDKKAQGITLFNLGAVYDAKGDGAKREQYFKRAEAIFRKFKMNRELRALEQW